MSAYMAAKNVVKDWPVIQPVKGVLINIDNQICQAFGQDPAFIVAGTGRCGTVYVTNLLNALGASCRHEYFYGPEGYNKRIGVKGDVSWLAVPFLEKYQGTVLHLVRHPLRVINALISAKALDNSRLENRYVRFLNTYFPLTGNQLEDAIRYYVEWNRKIENYAKLRIRLENIGEMIPKIMETLDIPCPENYKEIAQNTERVNARSRPCIRMEDIPAGNLRDELFAIAKDYGYEMENEE